jgi:hypothetical protein
MTEQTFIDLNFVRNDVSKEESGCDFDYHYYTIDIGDICLISNANDEAEKEGWWVSIFNSNTCLIKGAGDLETLIRILTNNMH